jgi:hypothetical protein
MLLLTPNHDVLEAWKAEYSQYRSCLSKMSKQSSRKTPREADGVLTGIQIGSQL